MDELVEYIQTLLSDKLKRGQSPHFLAKRIGWEARNMITRENMDRLHTLLTYNEDTHFDAH
jgi:hypothetical protein